MAELIAMLGETASRNNVKLIIFYHPRLDLNADGSVTSVGNSDDLELFSSACAENGVTFIDMADVFLAAYDSHRVLPHGFFNSPIGTRHLNAKGHEMIAERISRIILEMEGAA
jgi:hypothetical protein